MKTKGEIKMRKLFLLAVIILFFLLSPGYLHAQNQPSHSVDDLKIVEAEGEILLGDDTTPAQGRAMSRNNARRNALELAVGVKVHGSTVLYNSSLISDLVVTATKGLIVNEEIIEDGPKVKGDQIYHYCKLRAYVKPINMEKSGSLRIVRAEVVRAGSDRSLKYPAFQDNDEIQVHVRVNEASYINIFSVSQDGMITQLYPNQYFKSALSAADKTMVFPDDIQRAIGLKLRVRTPGKLSKALESVLIIATKENVKFLNDGGMEDPMLTDILRKLSELDPALWAEKTVGYEVRK